jgi:hypothetical protein
MIDKNKRYRTIHGYSVRIYAIDGGGKRPVHGAIWLRGGWSTFEWTKEGKSGIPCYSSAIGYTDLVEVTENQRCA